MIPTKVSVNEGCFLNPKPTPTLKPTWCIIFIHLLFFQMYAWST